MPEGPEVAITGDFLKEKLKGKKLTKIEIKTGRYTHQQLKGKESIDGTHTVINISSKGKMLYFELVDEKDKNRLLYVLSTLGLSGSWDIVDRGDTRVIFTFDDVNVYYTDQRNFGTIEITNNIHTFNKRINAISPDLLKTDYDDKILKERVKKRQKDKIIKVLMNQNSGLGSGLGNYLAPEILYRSKISPHRLISSITNDEWKTLVFNIKYLVKLAYYNNKIGYMEKFGNYIDIHRKKIDKGQLPDYHSAIKMKDDEFQFMVYRKKKDPLNNNIIADKILGMRTTYWVPDVQL